MRPFRVAAIAVDAVVVVVMAAAAAAIPNDRCTAWRRLNREGDSVGCFEDDIIVPSI